MRHSKNTSSEIAKEIASLAKYYGRELGADELRVYVDGLSHISLAAIRKAIQTAIRRDSRMPTVAAIRHYAIEQNDATLYQGSSAERCDECRGTGWRMKPDGSGEWAKLCQCART